MAIQDLTPQLRTRLSRVERVVGWFVILATGLLFAGFAYYVYSVAQREGWFLTKIPYFTYVRDATGLHVGDPVKLMGFDVGEIAQVTGTEAGKNWFTSNNFNVFVRFVIKEPYYGYVWSDSEARIGTGDLLGKRILEVVKGSTGEPTVIDHKGAPVRVLNKRFPGSSTNLDYLLLTQQTEGYWLQSDESPALTERLDEVAAEIESALPGIFALTNDIVLLLANGNSVATNLNRTLRLLQPTLDHAAYLSAQLTNGPGALGDWLIPTNINSELSQTLAAARATMAGADSTLATANTNLATLAQSLNLTLINLANMTSNLNTQVQANDQILSQISSAVVQADALMQGLKSHWLLRSAFKEKKAGESPKPAPPPKAGKGR